MEQTERNPYLEQEDYWAGYQKSIEAHKNNPQVIAFDKLCYEIFEHQEAGRKFLEMIKENYFLRPMVTKGNPTYQLDILWQEGFRDAWLMIMNSVRSHKQRIIAETN